MLAIYIRPQPIPVVPSEANPLLGSLQEPRDESPSASPHSVGVSLSSWTSSGSGSKGSATSPLRSRSVSPTSFADEESGAALLPRAAQAQRKTSSQGLLERILGCVFECLCFLPRLSCCRSS